MCTARHVPLEVIGVSSSRAKVTGDCDWPDMGAGK